MNRTTLIILAVIVGLYLVFSRRGFSPVGTAPQLGIGATPAAASNAGIIAASIGSLGASIQRALSGGSALPSGTPAPLVGAQPANFSDANAFYNVGIAQEQSLEEPTFGNNTNSFTIVGTGPAPIAAPNVTPSNVPSTGVLAFLNPNGNIPPPPGVDAGYGNYSTSSAAINPSGPTTSYGAGNLSLDDTNYLVALANAPAPVG